MKKFLGHLWYLSEELVAFAFFDDNVSANTILKMTRALQKPGAEHLPKRTSVIPAQTNSMQLHDFVTESTLRFFNITGLPATFLEKDVDT